MRILDIVNCIDRVGFNKSDLIDRMVHRQVMAGCRWWSSHRDSIHEYVILWFLYYIEDIVCCRQSVWVVLKHVNSHSTGQCISRFTNRKVPYCVKFNPDEDKQNLFVAGMSDKKIVQVLSLHTHTLHRG